LRGFLDSTSGQLVKCLVKSHDPSSPSISSSPRRTLGRRGKGSLN
jgi:hypothetical protein